MLIIILLVENQKIAEKTKIIKMGVNILRLERSYYAKNLPVYDFIGYKLLNATYSRIKITPVEYFIVKIVNSIYNEKTGLFEIFWK